MSGPKQISQGEENIFHCSTDESFPSVNLRWKLNGKLVEEGVEASTDEKDDGYISSSTFRWTTDGSAAQATLICFVEGMAMELHRQKLVKILGNFQSNQLSLILHVPGGQEQDTRREEVWQVVLRETEEEEFDIPVGFTFVDVNENNFRNYVARIKHLVTDEIAGKMEKGLVGFVMSDPDYLAYEEGEGVEPVTSEWVVLTRETVEEDFDIPDGFTLVDVNENNFKNYVSRIKHLLNDEIGLNWAVTIAGKMKNGLVGFAKSDSNTTLAKSDQDESSTVTLTNESVLPCLESKYQCCPDQIHPQHGYQAYGCCSSTVYGCCPDNITPAPAPYFDVS